MTSIAAEEQADLLIDTGWSRWPASVPLTQLRAIGGFDATAPDGTDDPRVTHAAESPFDAWGSR